MEKFQIFIQLTRLNKPTGFLLLFWPCVWGLTFGYYFNNETNIYFKYIVLYFFGSVLMRSAGCIINDIVDRNLDKKVERTKERPIPSGKISVSLGIFCSAFLCFLAFLVLLNFNKLTIFLAIASMPFAFSYPLMKRYTYWPQLFLGITFNYGLVLAWIAVTNKIDLAPIIFYFGAIFWTLGYDTIYGYQDIKDDEIIGVKSTSIKFKNNPKKFLILCYSITAFCLIFLGFIMQFNHFYFLTLLITFYHLFLYQIKSLDTKSPENCLKMFKGNNFVGLLIFTNILIGNLT